MRPLLTIVAAWVLLCLNSALAQTTHFVDAVNGSDTNPGTAETSAWKTISKVNSSSFNPGEQILFKRGEIWREQLTVPSSGSSDNPIIFGAYGSGALPIITGADLFNSGWSESYTNVWKRTCTTRPNIVFINGTQGTLKASEAACVAQGDWYRASNTLYVYSTSDPATNYTNPGVEAGQRTKCIINAKDYIAIENLSLEGWNQYKALDNGGSNVTYSNLIIQKGYGHGIVSQGNSLCNIKIIGSTITGQNLGVDAGWHGVEILAANATQTSSGITISSSTITNWTGVGIELWGYDADHRHSNITISNNTSSNNGCGIYLNWVDVATVSGNTLQNNTLTTWSGSEDYGIGLQTASNVTIENNIISGNRIDAIEVWGGTGGSPAYGNSDGNIIRYNEIYGNRATGLKFSSAYGNNNQVYYNLIYANTTDGLMIGHANSGNVVYNNSIYGNTTNGIEFYSNASGWTIKNNVFSGNANYALNAAATTDVAHANNLYYRSSGNSVTYNGSTYTSATITDFEATAVGQDPLFVDAGTNFHLQAGSPCIDAGTDVGLTADIEGTPVPQGASPDIGAYERIQQLTTPPSGPTLTSPPNGASGVSTASPLSWNASSGATSYGLQVSTSSTFSTTLVNEVGIIANSYALSGLANNTTYHWRVNATNAGGTSAYSSVWTFTTIVVAPSAPTLSSPSNGATSVSISPTLSWNTSGGATSYGLQVSTSSSFSTTVVSRVGITATSYAISGLSNNATYYWRVNATNAGGTSAYSATWSFTTDVSHGIVLPQGWSMVSSFVQPSDSALDRMLGGIVPQIVIMEDGAGHVFWPAVGINSIGTWNYRNGYMINMRSTDTLTITGNAIVPEATPLPLAQGVNLVAYLRNTPMGADSALASLQGVLLIAKNNAGQVYWPAYGINTIGSLTPGQGYQVQVTQASTLTYPANTGPTPPFILTEQQGIAHATGVPSPVHYRPSVSNTGASAILLIQSPELKEGDEIAVWTSSKMLVGSGVISKGKALITIWGDNRATQDSTDGAPEGETLSLTVWSAAEQKEDSLTLASVTDAVTRTSISNSLRYKTDAVWVAQARQVVAGVTPVKEIPKTFTLSQNYPNPFNPSSVIQYGLPYDAMVTLEIFNILGQQVALVVNEEEKAGYHEVVFQDTALGSGVYFYRLTAGKFTETRKMIVVR